MIFDAVKQHLFPCLINSFVVLYALSILVNKKINFKDYKFYVTLIFQTLVAVLTYLYFGNLVRLVIMTIVVIIGNYYLFRPNLKEVILSSTFEQLIVFVSEVIMTLILVLLFGVDAGQLTNNYFLNFISILLICSIMVVLIRLPFIKKTYDKFLKITHKIDVRKLSIYVLIIMISINFLFVSNFVQIEFSIIYGFNLFLIILYSLIVCYSMYQGNQNVKFKEENKSLLDNLNEYEKMLDYQRVNNHENKNQLLVIKGMIKDKNDKVVEYIDEIIKEKREDNETLYTQAKRIPEGGLQGLFYQKMLLMQEKDIKINLDISKEVRNIDLTCLSQKIIYDICRIIGVILDNAIEAVGNIDNNEILISMYVDDAFIIEISNKFNGNFDTSKIGDKGYTSKGKGHGYGLSLVKKIVEKSENVYLDTLIVNGVFTQKLKINI